VGIGVNTSSLIILSLPTSLGGTLEQKMEFCKNVIRQQMCKCISKYVYMLFISDIDKRTLSKGKHLQQGRTETCWHPG